MSDDDRVYPPVAGKIQRIAVSTTGAKTALISGLTGSGWLRIKAINADVDFTLCSNADTQITKDATAEPLGYTLVAGQAEDFYNPGGHDSINWDAAGSGFLVIMRSGRDRIQS